MQQIILFHKYRIVKLLGNGGTSKVYLAKHIQLNSYRAIKCISKNHPLYDLQRKEAFLLKNLKHSCIPIIYDIEEDEESSYIVEQYIEGETLKEYIRKRGHIGEEAMINFMLQLCDLLLYLHSLKRPILYSDIKPDNLIIADNELKLIDFGSAIYFDELKDNQTYCGTIGFSAPELYQNRKIDDRCEVYSIGMLLYYMVTGQDSIQQLKRIDDMTGCSKKLKGIINGCLRYHSSQRYSSVINLRKQLLSVLRKNSFHQFPNHKLQIAVAGSQTRIGVTHLSFRLCRYFIRQKRRCLYIEKNNSQGIKNMKRCYTEVICREGVYQMKGISMLPKEHSCDMDRLLEKVQYHALIMDYGSLNKDNLKEFLAADIKILVVGTKDWELSSTDRVLDLVAEEKEVFYLFNFINGRQFHQVMKSMKQKNCHRIPYETDPFAAAFLTNEKEMFQDMIRSAQSQTPYLERKPV